ncbi:MAG: AMP-binding protein, partial [Pseudomonadota bacterium]
MTVHAPRGAQPWRAHWPAGIPAEPTFERLGVGDLLLRAEAAHGDRCALECRGLEMTYAELTDRARRFASALRRAGLAPGDTVALHLPNTCWHPIAFFGAMFAGCRVAHLSPLDPPRVLAHKLGDSEARLVVGTDLPPLIEATTGLVAAGAVPRAVICRETEFAFPAEGCGAIPEDPAIQPSDAFLEGAEPLQDLAAAAPEDIALLQYTGGTTGLPKGAMLSHGNLTAAVAIIGAWNDHRADDPPPERPVGLCVLPLFHIFALTGLLLRGVAQGAKLLIRLRFDPAEALNDIERHGVTAFPGVPTMWIALIDQPGIETRDLSTLSTCLSGGAPLPVEVGRRFTRLTGLELGVGWGMTETSPV